jgi:hypothetical protein
MAHKQPRSTRKPASTASDVPAPAGDAKPTSAEPAMPAAGDEATEHYAVGYQRPPLHSRFMPGQSGNPKGRTRESRNMRTIVKKVLNEEMKIREGGRIRRMAAFEALVRATLARSFKGDPKATASLIILLRHYAVEHDEPVTGLELLPEHEAIVSDFLARYGFSEAINSSSQDGNATPSSARSEPKEKP